MSYALSARHLRLRRHLQRVFDATEFSRIERSVDTLLRDREIRDRFKVYTADPDVTAEDAIYALADEFSLAEDTISQIVYIRRRNRSPQESEA